MFHSYCLLYTPLNPSLHSSSLTNASSPPSIIFIISTLVLYSNYNIFSSPVYSSCLVSTPSLLLSSWLNSLSSLSSPPCCSTTSNILYLFSITTFYSSSNNSYLIIIFSCSLSLDSISMNVLSTSITLLFFTSVFRVYSFSSFSFFFYFSLISSTLFCSLMVLYSSNNLKYSLFSFSSCSCFCSICSKTFIYVCT